MWKYSTVSCKACKYFDNRYNIKYCDILQGYGVWTLNQLGCKYYIPSDPRYLTNEIIKCPTCSNRFVLYNELDTEYISYGCKAQAGSFICVYCHSGTWDVK